ncbi:DUF2795 domain-containing protein [Saccharomonospora viridis]|nr:DUF2795 domain-containing protein [Saccharomonospora viridis]
MREHLSGGDHPCVRSELVRHARGRGAGADVLQRLESMPDRTCDGPSAGSAEIL